MSSGELIAEWRERLEQSVTETQVEAGALSQRQLQWNPPEGGWSVGQVLDHLAQTNEEYLPTIRQAIARGRPAHEGVRWKPSLFGGLLARALLNPRKMPTVKAFKPAESASHRPLERFVRSVHAIAGEMDSAKAVDLRTRVHSPASKLVRLNLGDALYLQVIHAERHLQQIRRVREHTDFPA